MRILAIDPSGNFHEGKGTTGWCILDTVKYAVVKTGHICASDYQDQLSYWDAHVKLLMHERYDHIVIEDYLLYADKANNQINSRFETPKLIGLLQYVCYINKISLVLEPAATVKNRWNNDVLIYKGFIVKGSKGFTTSLGAHINKHEIDAIRHAVHFMTFIAPPVNKGNWTEEEDALIIKYYEEGMLITELASRLNRTQSAVRARASRLQSKRRRAKPHE